MTATSQSILRKLANAQSAVTATRAQRQTEVFAMPAPFTLSIEDTAGHSYQPAWPHLGTDEGTARQIAELRYFGRIAYGLPVVTVAIMRDRKMVDCFDGRWSSEEDVEC